MTPKQKQMLVDAQQFEARYPGRAFEVTPRAFHNPEFSIVGSPKTAMTLVKDGRLRIVARVSNGRASLSNCYRLTNSTSPQLITE